MGEAKKSVIPEKQTNRTMINIRLTPEEYQKIKTLADRYAAGNMSNWLRYKGTEDLNLAKKPKK